MNIREVIDNEHSQQMAISIAKYVGTDPKRMAELMDLFFDGNKKQSQRAAYPMMYITDYNIQMFKPYVGRLIENLQNKVHVAITRNTLRLFQDMKVPEKYQSEMLDFCFAKLHDESPIAIKANAMTVAFNICRDIPELRNELKLELEDILPYGSTGLKARAKNVLSELDKLAKTK